MQLTIDRDRWARADRPDLGVVSMLNEQDASCPMGFLALRLGYLEEEIRGELNPCNRAALDGDQNRWPLEFVEVNPLAGTNFGGPASLRNTLTTVDIMIVNGDGSIHQEEREDRLAKLFAAAGIELVFTGGDDE